ncbi:MAG TPA: hypothetical protein VJY62_07975 [Bacteroidia bacterium]|nr:hypothetical protein [Bacteroidia bacterium]
MPIKNHGVLKGRAYGKEKIKFEEDIKVPFLKLYSFSGNIEISNQRELKKVKDVIKIFPGLADSFIKYERDEAIQLVNGFSAKEIVFTSAMLKLSNNPDAYSECALIIWYNMQKQDMNPVVGEFSFRYVNKKEKYSGKTAQRAYDLFKLLKEEKKDWIDINGGTKTGFVYNPL